jgi:hypothetical protein
LLALVAVLVGVGLEVDHRVDDGPALSPMRSRIVQIAQSQLGYRTDPSDSYCNRYSAYWDAGTDDCGNSNLDEEWCADFAAWVWKQAGAEVEYQLAPGYLNSDSASFYVWGLNHHTWHPIGTPYTPQPGDVAIYGLDTSTVTADHVAIVTAATTHQDAPDVINGDGDRTGFSVVETGSKQVYADTKGGSGSKISGYVSPEAPSGSSGS